MNAPPIVSIVEDSQPQGHWFESSLEQFLLKTIRVNSGLRNRNMIRNIPTWGENSVLRNRKTAGKIPVWWEISLSGRKKVFHCMDHLVLRHPSYRRRFTYPFSISVYNCSENMNYWPEEYPASPRLRASWPPSSWARPPAPAATAWTPPAPRPSSSPGTRAFAQSPDNEPRMYKTLNIFSYLSGMSPYISSKIKKRHYEHHMIEAHK